MKILFICGSLEPGKDGVGDYTRRLGAALIGKGFEISILSLYDRFVSDPQETIQFSDNFEVPVLRLPSLMVDRERYDLAKSYVDKKDPVWLSLQFVIFSFHPKGLPLRLSKNLSSLGQGRLWHIMFHELWVGMPVHATKKHVYWGKIQSFLIKTLIKKLNPSMIHTQSQLYMAQLKRIGFRTQQLPLFSNIPVIATSSYQPASINEGTIYIVVFGAIHPHNCIEEFIIELQAFEKRTNTRAIVQLLGKNGSEKDNWIKLFKASGFRVEALGEQPPEVISKVLKKASVGISTSAMVMIEKSGTVAAMLEHGVPVICIAKPWVPRELNLTIKVGGVYPLRKGCIEQSLQYSKISTNTVGVENISERFAESLECVNSHFHKNCK